MCNLFVLKKKKKMRPKILGEISVLHTHPTLKGRVGFFTKNLRSDQTEGILHDWCDSVGMVIVNGYC